MRGGTTAPSLSRFLLYGIRSGSGVGRHLSTLRNRDDRFNEAQVWQQQQENEPCVPRIDHLLQPDTTVWSDEDWNLAQDFLDADSSAQEHLNQSVELLRQARRHAERSGSPTPQQRLYLHKTIGLWHYRTIVHPQPKKDDDHHQMITPREWVGMIDDHPTVFKPYSLSNLSLLVHATVKRRNDDTELAISLLDRMIGQMTILVRQNNSNSHHHHNQPTLISSSSYSSSSPSSSPTARTPLTAAQSLVQLAIHNVLHASATRHDDDLEGTLTLFAKYQPYMDRSGYNAVLLALARHGHGQEAEQLLDEMCKGYCVDWTGMVISPDLRSFNLALSAWSRCTSDPSAPERAHAILLRLYDPFDWGALGISPDDVSWNTILKAWARSSRPDAVSSAVHVLREMDEYGQAGMSEAKPTAIAYGTVLDAMAKRGQAEVAERLWMDMYHSWECDPDRGAVPNWVSATSVLQAWSLSNRPDRTHRAADWFRRVQSLISDDEPDSVVYHALFSCYAGLPTVEAAQLAEELLQRCLHPDFVTYSILIQHFTRVPGYAYRACELMRIVQDKYRSGDDSFRPDSKSLDSILQSFSKVDISTSTKVLSEILNDVSEGRCVPPSIKSFGLFMHACKSSDDPFAPRLALELVKKMDTLYQAGVLPQGPDHLIYRSLISMWTRVKNSSRVSLNILIAFRDKSRRGDLNQGPTTLDYNLVIRSLAKEYHPARAHMLMEEMVSSRDIDQCRPDASTFHSVLWGWAKVGNADALQNMKAVFQRMDQLGLVHDTVARNNVIHCLSRMGEPERAESVLRSMRNSHDRRMRASPVSYESVLVGWLKKHDIERAHSILVDFDEECRRGSFVPLERPYLTMRLAWEKAGNEDKANATTAMWLQIQNKRRK
jgi:pentatricopeptide repeat protein